MTLCSNILFSLLEALKNAVILLKIEINLSWGFHPKLVFTIKLKKIRLQTSLALYAGGDLGAGFVDNFMFCCILGHALMKSLKFSGLRIWLYHLFLCVSSFHYHHLWFDTQKVTHLLPFPEYFKSIRVDSFVVNQVCCLTVELGDLAEIPPFLSLRTNSTRCHLVSRWRRRFDGPCPSARSGLVRVAVGAGSGWGHCSAPLINGPF